MSTGLAFASVLAFGCGPRTVAPHEATQAPPRASTELDAVTIEPRPAWTDRYWEDGPDQRRFNISAVMARYELNRAQAVEAQNHYRDLAREQPGADLDGLLETAVQRAKAGQFEDGRDVAALAAARFIVVFDLDDTLYDQYIPNELAATCHDFVVPTDGDPRHVKLTPGWDHTIRRIHELGGATVLFTANTDERSWDNAAVWMLDGKPIASGSLVAGFLTNSHLVQQTRDEGTGATNPRKGQPVQEPSKDLRIVDESLSRAIIVDDNPLRLFQPANARVFKKFHAAEYCASKDPDLKRAYEQALPIVLGEIEEALRYVDAHPGTDFAAAYRPYTAAGQIALAWIRDTTGRSQADAIAWLRAHPEVIGTRY